MHRRRPSHDFDGITPLQLGDPRYPARLAAIHDPPPFLWVVGKLEALTLPAVAIVGSRAGSPYALEVATRLGSDLARRGVAVVSGLARGVDSAAHRGALEGSGTTIAVLGSGVDVIYPPEHAELAKNICDCGALLSEFPPGTPPLAGHFPQRNRLISGLSLAVVVVEAAEKSGSLITAGFALEQGREVLAVPGNILGGRNRGAHALLRDGAKIVESADDILEEIRLPGFGPPSFGESTSELRRGRSEASAEAGGRESGIGTQGPDRGDSASEDGVLQQMIPGEAYDLDELARRSSIDPVTLLQRLLEHELAGIVQRIDGGRFVRFRGTC